MSIYQSQDDPLFESAFAPALSTDDFAHRVVANKYGFYCIPEAFRGRTVPDILANGDVYEPATLGLMTRILRRGGDVITGGAFVGDFLPALSAALQSGARLHSFEPNPVAHGAAVATIGLNALDNVTLHACAVGEKPDTLALQVAKADGTAMAARARIAGSTAKGETVAVDVATLDTLVGSDRRVSLLHLDVEGHELPALAGAQEVIQTHWPCIIVEAAKRWKRRAIESHLMARFPDAGYRPAGRIERNAIFLPQPARRPAQGG